LVLLLTNVFLVVCMALFALLFILPDRSSELILVLIVAFIALSAPFFMFAGIVISLKKDPIRCSECGQRCSIISYGDMIKWRCPTCGEFRVTRFPPYRVMKIRS
jgi:predicted RNA-binding Zn-ribbon protein involved in translation (DUF1610 family)